MDTPQSTIALSPRFIASYYKIISYVSYARAFLAVLGVFLGAGVVVSYTQILPPETAYKWSGGAGTSAWADAANWAGGEVPPEEAELLFGNLPSGAAGEAKLVENVLENRRLRSLWFETGFDYTISGDPLWLGDTLEDGGQGSSAGDGALITVLNRADRHSEITFNNAVNVTTLNPAHAFVIYNESLGGLRFNGGFNTGGHTIRVEGQGGVRFAGAISGASAADGGVAGELRVAMSGGHAVFAADNSAWGGTIHVDSGMAVVTANGALGSTALATTVADGATLAFRQANLGNGPQLNYTSAKMIHLTGAGAWRWGLGHVGALYSDGGRNRFAGNIVLMGDAAVGARMDLLRLTGTVTGNASLTKVGGGVVSLANSGNAYTGATIIREGGLWIENEAAFPGGFGNTNTGTNIVLDGGVLVLPTSTGDWKKQFARQLGTGPGQIQWTGSGGFSAMGNAWAYVELANEAGVAEGKLTWGQGGFVPLGSALLFGSEYSGGLIHLRNAIDLAGGMREINVQHNTTAGILGEYRHGGISNGGLLKTGAGILHLRGDIRYTGPTVIRDGALSLDGMSTTNVQLDGGTFLLQGLNTAGDVVAHLGAGAGQVQWLAGRDGGLAADGGVLQTLRFNGSQDEITWGQQYFVGEGSTLILGHRSSSVATLVLDTALNLAGAERTIRVIDSLIMDAEAKKLRAELKFTQALRNGSLRIVGDGRADMAVANDELKGSVTVEAAELRLNEDGSLSGLSALRAARGGIVTLDNAGTHDAATGGANLSDRVRDTATVTLDAGTLRFWGSDVADTVSSETFGAVTLTGGDNTIDVVNRSSGASGSATLNLASLTRSDETATLRFTNSAGIGSYTATGPGPRLRFTTAPALSGGILPWAIVSDGSYSGTHWATVTGDGFLVAYSDYKTTAPSTWTATDNASVNQYRYGIGQLKVNSLRFGSWTTLNFQFPNASTVLNIISGGLLAVDGGYLHLGRVTTSADVLHIHTQSPSINSQLDISSEIFGSAKLVKSGKGRLLLWGDQANTYTGTTYVNGGLLALNKAAGANAIEGDIVVGDFDGKDTLLIAGSDQIADTAKVTLRGVYPTQPMNFGGFHEGVLQMNNGGVLAGVRESFDTLHIHGLGVLNFAGGEVARANYLYLNHLTFADAASRLIIRNYIEHADFLLIRRAFAGGVALGQIVFGDYGATRLVPFDKDYMRISPFPEPESYGAILGLLGLALWALRKQGVVTRRIWRLSGAY